MRGAGLAQAGVRLYFICKSKGISKGGAMIVTIEGNPPGATRPLMGDLSPHDGMHKIKLVPLGLCWFWQARFYGYGADDRETGFALTKARAKDAAELAIDEMRHRATD